MFRSQGRVAVAGSFVLLAACSQPAPPPPMEVDPMSAELITQFYAELATARCERFVTCCDSQQQEELLFNIPSLESMERCESYFASVYERSLEEAILAVERRTMRVDTTAMEQCLEATRMCGPVEVCEDALAGMLSEMEDCLYDVECVRGKCIVKPENMFMWCSYGEPGSHCGFHNDCLTPGYYCGPDDLCIPKKEANEPCQLDVECASEDCYPVFEGSNERRCLDVPPPPLVSIDICDGV